MINDVKVVVWKEWREHILQYGSVTKWLLSSLMLVGLIGIFLPLQFGRTAVESVSLLFWMWIPLLIIINSMADSIAGERERHSLETLLASRLPDRAILLGKIAVPVFQSWLGMLIGAVLALITVNLTKSEGQLIMYPAPVAFGIVAIPLAGGLLVAGIGVIASAHAATVRQAYQRIVIPIFGVIIVLGIAQSLLPSSMLANLYSPEFAQNGAGWFILVTTLFMAGLDAVILVIAFKRFQRSRLIED